MIGEDALTSDKLMRSYELTKLAERKLEHYSEETLRIFQAYCDGVNDFV